MHDRPDKAKLSNCLSRVQGHVRGIARMVEQDRYCIDIPPQLQAARAIVSSPIGRGRGPARRAGKTRG